MDQSNKSLQVINLQYKRFSLNRGAVKLRLGFKSRSSKQGNASSLLQRNPSGNILYLQ